MYDVGAQSFRHVRLSGTFWTVALQAPLSMGFHRQEYWSGLPFPTPEDISDPGIKPVSPASQADSLPPDPPGKSSLVLRTLNLWNEAALHFVE